MVKPLVTARPNTHSHEHFFSKLKIFHNAHNFWTYGDICVYQFKVHDGSQYMVNGISASNYGINNLKT